MFGIENFLGLDHHLPFLLGRAVVEELVDVRDAVECDLLGELLRRRGLVHVHRLGMREELVHPFLARTGHRLVGRHHHAPDPELVVQRLQRHHHLNGGAVRVGDDVAAAELRPKLRQRLGVHLRYHQRNVGLHAELAGVVDHHAAGGGGARRMHGGDRRAGREQPDVPAAKIERVQVADGEHLLLAERHLLTGGPARGDSRHLVGGKVALRQGLQHLASDRPGGSDDCDPVAHPPCSFMRPIHQAFGARGRSVSGGAPARQAS